MRGQKDLVKEISSSRRDDWRKQQREMKIKPGQP